ncbi:bile acid:sodium symporter, partial [Melaminivora alkalimesophila]
VCSASASTLLGIFITPVLVGAVLPQAGSAEQDVLAGIGRIMLQLMLPFVAGHLLRPWIGGFMARHAAALKYVDQGSVLLVVYTAFSAAVAGGLWKLLPLP